MMRWKSLLAVAVSSVLFGACTVTVDDSPSDDDDAFDDDSDDISVDEQDNFDDDFSNEDDFEDPSELDEDSDDDATDAGSTDETTDETTNDTGETTDTATEDAGDTTDETTSDSTDTDAGSTDETTDETTDTGETTDDTDGGMTACELPEAEPPSCEACLDESCGAEYEACFCDPTCAAELQAVRDCYKTKNTMDNPSDDQGGDWALCEEMAAGDDGELSDTYYGLVSCAGTSFEPGENAGDDPYGRTEGDGTCTAACFDLFSFDF